MRPTDFTLNEQLRITTHEISRRKHLLDLTDDEIKTLNEAKPIILSDLENITNLFYKELVEMEGAPQLIGDAETLHRLKNYLQRYVRTLFEGPYDMDYVQSRLRIGLVHKRIGVPPKLYIAAYKILSRILRGKLRSESKKISCEVCSGRSGALEKVMLFDLVFVFDTFIQSLVNEVSQSKQNLEEYARELEVTVHNRTKQLKEQASKDGLTGLFNQRTFFEHLRAEVSRSQRRADTFSLCYFDLDNFKKVNDIHGHQQGDEVLIAVGTAINKVLRQEDTGARYGGDEFCIILPQTSAEQAKIVCKRLIKIFSEITPQESVTLSIGLAEFIPDTNIDPDTLIKHADKAMYSSKKQSGHYVTVYTDELIPSAKKVFYPNI
ncbi:GGDEF domain-containing protein [Halodesulfovibrio marinisediminis]|uniref:Diguanylate cyclase DosC n=1 Tax=Halodesulfovibrio marinisediminis DSM 17456 TaxID=1121457 RepID=A0A1N6HHF7_9BACT|nr:GGDEF domain-containing protein [Halodesulfovibrio marinisediminis]SIO19192.1 diguanylate cyclase (GGDEF) domain-containing protein [Halodesulfovibrio marinisediminis DSM 17456]